jgi:hypothetical protein
LLLLSYPIALIPTFSITYPDPAYWYIISLERFKQ